MWACPKRVTFLKQSSHPYPLCSLASREKQYLHGLPRLSVDEEVVEGQAPVQAHLESGTFDGHFSRGSGFGQTEGNTSDACHIFRLSVFANAGSPLLENHIQAPVERFFQAPWGSVSLWQFVWHHKAGWI